MLITKKENYILVTSEEENFTEFYKKFKDNYGYIKDGHLIIHISKKISIENKDFLLFLDIAEEKQQNGTSFVIVNSVIDIDNFPESLNIVPTLQEAEDILEMEAIERELGF
ncbi:hypothetical protein [uncultured Polaribacter sp.]|uniref:hypothetical protein n=1 Tax=uncultured Polaribacter sp. TaxID=174711 RepID=UPI00261AECCF|nr:hypothetical protein [uncultured Polaribacter sp.]